MDEERIKKLENRIEMLWVGSILHSVALLILIFHLF